MWWENFTCKTQANQSGSAENIAGISPSLYLPFLLTFSTSLLKYSKTISVNPILHSDWTQDWVPVIYSCKNIPPKCVLFYKLLYHELLPLVSPNYCGYFRWNYLVVSVIVNIGCSLSGNIKGEHWFDSSFYCLTELFWFVKNELKWKGLCQHAGSMHKYIQSESWL